MSRVLTFSIIVSVLLLSTTLTVDQFAFAKDDKDKHEDKEEIKTLESECAKKLDKKELNLDGLFCQAISDLQLRVDSFFDVFVSIDDHNSDISALEARISLLEAENADLNRLLDFIHVDTPNPGDITIQTTGSDIIMAPAPTGEFMVLSNTMMNGDLMFEQPDPMIASMAGDLSLEVMDPLSEINMMADTMTTGASTVMGDAMLEGPATFMQEANLMDVTNVEGTLILPDQTTNVVDGILTPTTSTVTIFGFVNNPNLFRIIPAAIDGTVLELRFAISSIEDIGPDVVNCSTPFGNFCGSAPGEPNIKLKSSSFEYLFNEGDVLRLVSDGPFWREVSRSSATTTVFSITDNFIMNPGDIESKIFQCSDFGIGKGSGGSDLPFEPGTNTIMLTATAKATALDSGDTSNPNYVPSGSQADFVNIQDSFELDQVGPNEFVETYVVDATNNSDILGNHQDASVDVNIRCMIP